METAVIRVPSDDPHVDASFEPVFQHTNKKFVCTKYVVPHHQKNISIGSHLRSCTIFCRF